MEKITRKIPVTIIHGAAIKYDGTGKLLEQTKEVNCPGEALTKETAEKRLKKAFPDEKLLIVKNVETFEETYEWDLLKFMAGGKKIATTQNATVPVVIPEVEKPKVPETATTK